jgi:hypothetical protein
MNGLVDNRPIKTCQDKFEGADMLAPSRLHRCYSLSSSECTNILALSTSLLDSLPDFSYLSFPCNGRFSQKRL